MSTRHGRKRNGPGLWAGKDLDSCHCACQGDITDVTIPCKEMRGSDDWLETSRSALFKYLVLKKWNMREAGITATV
jgi:hypothetical protein